MKAGMQATTEPDQIITRKPTAKSIDIVVNDAEEMSLEIAKRLLKLDVDANELEIVRTNTLHRDMAYMSLNGDERRVIDYMCRSLKVSEIEVDGRRWRTSYEFFRKLFTHHKTHDEIRTILKSLANNRFEIRNVKTGKEEIFSWLNEVIFLEESGTIIIEISARVSEYHRIPLREQISAYGGFTQYYLTASLGLLLQHQNFFHHVLGRRVEWSLKHKHLTLKETPIEITVEEMRRLWGLSETTKPYDLERFWLRDACERMSVATQVRISRYEPLRAAARGRPVYAYRLYITELAKVDFLKRFESLLELAKEDRSVRPHQTELPLPEAGDRPQRLAAIKAALQQLGAYNGQLKELELLADSELSWVEGQMAIWASAGSAIYKEYKNEGNKEQTRMGLLWRCIKHRLALQTEYPRAFLAIERQKKKVELDSAKVKEPSLDGFEILKDRAQQLATWFSSLDTTRQTSFVDQMLDDGPQPAGVMSGKAFRTVVDKVFLQGKYSPLVPDFEKRAAELGYQAQ
jgi:hypothetical protein